MRLTDSLLVTPTRTLDAKVATSEVITHLMLRLRYGLNTENSFHVLHPRLLDESLQPTPPSLAIRDPIKMKDRCG